MPLRYTSGATKYGSFVGKWVNPIGKDIPNTKYWVYNGSPFLLACPFPGLSDLKSQILSRETGGFIFPVWSDRLGKFYANKPGL